MKDPTVNFSSDGAMLVHIGYHKCGSTWLQRQLFSRTDRGFYPIAPKGKADAKWLWPYFVMDASGHILSPFTNRSDEVRSLIAGFRGNGVPVVSSERLSGQPQAGGIDSDRIARRLVDAFPDARILIVIREQRSLLVSTYFQYLKAGGHRHYRHYFETVYDSRKPGFTPSFFEYHGLIALYCELFGAENVLCLPYEMLFGDGPAFMERLRGLTGAKIPDGLPFHERIKDGLPRNVELKTRHFNLLRHSNSLNGHALNLTWKNQIDGLRRGLNKIVPKSWNRATVTEVQAYVNDAFDGFYAASNSRTEDLIGVPLKERFGYQ